MGIMSVLGSLFGGGPWKLTDPGLSRAVNGGTDSYAGKPVTADTAMMLATVYACVRLISSTIATLPLGIYEQDAAGRKSAARGHPLYTLLHDQPNADMTACEFWQAMLVCLLLRGNAFAEKSVLGRRIVALTPLRPEWMAMRRDESGRIVFRYSAPGGQRDLAEDQVLHLKGLTLDGLVGLSPVAQARHTLGLGMAADEAAGKVFANGMRVPGYVKSGEPLTKDKRELVDAVLERFQGTANTGKTPVLPTGWSYESLTLPPLEAQLLETRKFSVEEICRWFGTPPFMVGHTEKTTSWGTGLEQQNIGFLTYCLAPYLRQIEQAVRKSLLFPEERGRFYAEFNLDGLLRADSAGRAALASAYATNGIETRNEIRARSNLPPLEGGDMLTVQSAMVPLATLGKAPAAPTPPPGNPS